MEQPNLCDMTISEILRRWPSTISVFIDLRMHCIGCPIGIFHTPVDAAAEHGIPLELLLAELNASIAGHRVRRVPVNVLRRSERVGAAPVSGGSVDRPPRARRAPTR